MASPLVWKSFELLNFMFRFMYPARLCMNPREQVLTTHPLNWKIIPWLINGIFGIVFVGIPPLIYIFFREAYIPLGTTSLMRLSIYISVLITNLFTLAQNTGFLINSNSPAFNAVLKWDKSLEKDFPELAKLIVKEDKNRPDFIGILLCFTAVLFGSSPLGATLFSLFFNLDQFDYVLEDILPDPMERETVEHIVMPFLLRLFLFLPLVLEGFRTMSFSIMLTTTYINVIKHGFRILEKITSPSQFFHRYRQIQLVNLAVKEAFGYVAAVYIVSGQTLTVVLLWVTVNGYNHVPSFILFMIFPIFAFITIAFTIIMFEQSIAIYEKSRVLVEAWKIGCVSRNAGKRTYTLGIRREIKKAGRAQHPILMNIGGLRVIKRSFQIEYLNLLMDNFIDVMLLVKV
ncbi:unnamed protein product [Orchesella dallaii]|uniref:Gustatory receptor n=1 Tax=Orchesella dallaii TaxID=48710 RepID=A0ABP1RMN6_9HEXA